MSGPSLPPPVLYDPATHIALLPQLVQLHKDCVAEDHMLATFLDIHHPTKIPDYWRRLHEQVVRGTRLIFLQFAEMDSSSSAASEGVRREGEEGEVAGVVMLDVSMGTETGPFRCNVQKLMTSPRHRKKGIARRLMASLEEAAKARQSYMVLLDTVIGSGADLVYPKLGYTRVGMIPKYGISPRDGSLVDEVFFYKDLRDGEN